MTSDAPMSSIDEAREQIAQIVVTLRVFTRAVGAFATLLLLDQGDATPPLAIECPSAGPVELSEGEDVVQLDPDLLAAAPLPLPDVRPLPPFDVDGVRAEITAPLGGIEHHGRAVRELVALFPGRSVLTVTWETTDLETPLHLAARTGDPLVLVLGEEQFEMAPGWPPA
jgi:hypothetical protein